MILLLPGGVGLVLGSILMNRWEGRLNRVGWIAVGLTGLGFGLALLGLLSGARVQATGPGDLAPVVSLVLPLILALGFMLVLVIVPARTVLQERPPPEIRGRAIAAQLALANAAAVIPLLLGGALADQLGLQPVMGILGALAVGAGAVGLHQMHRV